MFFKTNRPPNSIDSLIGAGTRIEGDVFFSGGLRLDGTVRGNMSALPERPGTLFLGKKARIEGEVAVPHVVVYGTINGKVMASETLEMQSSARVSGEVFYKLISVQEGAIIEGQLAHRASIESKQEAALKLASGG